MPFANNRLHPVIELASRHKLLIIATILLMAGAGCVSAVKTTNDQLSEDATASAAVPVTMYPVSGDDASSSDATLREPSQQGIPAP